MSLNMLLAVCECLRDRGKERPSGIAAGELFAYLTGHMTLGTFIRVVHLLKREGFAVENDAYLLQWIGPLGPTTLDVVPRTLHPRLL